MSNFLNIFKKIGNVIIGAEHVAAPVIEMFVPQFAVLDNIFQKIQTAIVATEQAIPTNGQGTSKSQAVVNDFNAGLEITQQLLALDGKKMTYDAALLQKVIDAQVLVFNSMAALKASFKIEPITP